MMEVERKEECLVYDNRYHIRQITVLSPSISVTAEYEKHFFVNGFCEMCGHQYVEEPGMPDGTVFLNYERNRHIMCVPRKHGRENSYMMQKQAHYFINGKCELCGAPELPDRSHSSLFRTPEIQNMMDMMFTHELAIQRDMIRGDLDAVKNSCRSRIEILDTLDKLEDEHCRKIREAEQLAKKKRSRQTENIAQVRTEEQEALQEQTFDF